MGETWTHYTKWKKPETKGCMLLFQLNAHSRQIHGDREYINSCQSLVEKEKWRMTYDGYELSFWGNKNILELDNGDDCTT